MKKAKDYAEILVKYKHDEELFKTEISKVIIELMKEIYDLVKTRNAIRTPAIKSIVNELNKKWIAICRRVELKNQDELFLESIDKLLPELSKGIGR